ncbi:MAG: NAD-dependent deacetylase [Dehalococcoidia bacterium]
MSAPSESESIAEAAAILLAARHVVALTGAGVSKESGIPTFRGKDGLWTVRGEPPLNQFEEFRRDPKAWWVRRLDQRARPDEFALSLRASEPNDAHYALAELEALGVLHHVITQNVDNLHRRAGQQSITEIHGNMRWMRCTDCQTRWPEDDVDVNLEELPPRCPEPGCAGIVKGDGVMFGEPIPPDALERCYAETAMADAFLLAGTSAVVYPAAMFPQLAYQRGARLIEVDPEPTALSELATVTLRGPAGEMLPLLLRAVRERIGPQ